MIFPVVSTPPPEKEYAMRETLAKMRSTLEPIYGKGETDAMIRIIFKYLKNWNLTDIAFHIDDPLSDFIKSEIDKILKRLQNREPIQYITGSADFFGLDIKVEPGVLVPRTETEGLVQAVLDDYGGRTDLDVVDAGTGSGCIACALARNLVFPHVTAFDISPEALKVAGENAKNLRCPVQVEKEDILSWNPREESLDIIVSNPPYVDESEKKDMDRNVLDYEPEIALFVPDSDPLRFYKALSKAGMKGLRKGGRIYFEINPLHKDAMVDLLKADGYTDVEAWLDYQGRYRFVKGVK